jgi:hypothetical protein
MPVVVPRPGTIAPQERTPGIVLLAGYPAMTALTRRNRRRVCNLSTRRGTLERATRVPEDHLDIDKKIAAHVRTRHDGREKK